MSKEEAVRILKNWTAAVTFSALLFYPELKIWTFAWNRFCYHWSVSDALSRLLLLVITGTLITLLYELLLRFKSRRIVQMAKWCFVVLSGFLVVDSILTPFFLENASHAPGRGWLHIWLPITVVYVLFGILVLRAIDRFAFVLRQVFLIFSPILLILSVQYLSAKSWAVTFERDLTPKAAVTIGTSGVSSDKHMVLLVIYDCWMLGQCMDESLMFPSAQSSDPKASRESTFLEKFKNLNALASDSLVFTRALAPGGATRESIPAILYGKKGDLAIHGEEVYLSSGNTEELCRNSPSVFDSARHSGYSTALLGFYFPYTHLLSGPPDSVYVHRSERGGEPRNPLTQCVWKVVERAGDFLYPPLFHAVRPLRTFRRYAHLRAWYSIVTEMQRQTLEWVAESPESSFLYFHLPDTHGPFVVADDGSFHTSGVNADAGESAVDATLGLLVKQLKELGRYNNTTIILTADHYARYTRDPRVRDIPHWRRWVPLIIKCPKQEHGVIIGEPFETLAIKEILELAFRNELTADRVEEIAGRQIKEGI